MFDEIHLVDLDPAALEAAVGPAEDVRVATGTPSRAGGPVGGCRRNGNLAGAGGSSCGDRRVPTAHRDDAVAGARRAVRRRAVAVRALADRRLRERHARRRSSADGRAPPALRDRHLRLMAGQVAPGGWGILITDVASSRAVPGLEAKPPDELPDLLRTLSARGRCYAGLDPAAVEAALRADPLAAWQIADVQTLAPWLLEARTAQDVPGVRAALPQGPRDRGARAVGRSGRGDHRSLTMPCGNVLRVGPAVPAGHGRSTGPRPAQPALRVVPRVAFQSGPVSLEFPLPAGRRFFPRRPANGR